MYFCLFYLLSEDITVLSYVITRFKPVNLAREGGGGYSLIWAI